MAIDLTVDVHFDRQPGENKMIDFADLRDTYKEILGIAKEHRVDVTFFEQIVAKMPSLGKLAIERLRSKFNPYLVKTENDGSRLVRVTMGEIASLDDDLQRRLLRRAKDLLSSFGPLANCKEVQTGKNPEGEWVIKLIYETDLAPASNDRNSYDEETKTRTTWSQKLSNEQEATTLAQWLAGVIDVRHSMEVLK